jgi:hypothetical protein
MFIHCRLKIKISPDAETERQHLALNQQRVVLDLIDRRHHARILDYFAQVMDLEVADPDHPRYKSMTSSPSFLRLTSNAFSVDS